MNLQAGGVAGLAEQNNRVSVLLLLQSVAVTAAAGLPIASHLLYKGRPGIKSQPTTILTVLPKLVFSAGAQYQCNVTGGKAMPQ